MKWIIYIYIYIYIYTHTHTHTVLYSFKPLEQHVCIPILGTVLVPKHGSSYVKYECKRSVGYHLNTSRGTQIPYYQISTMNLHVLILNTEPSSWIHLTRGFCNSIKGCGMCSLNCIGAR